MFPIHTQYKHCVSAYESISTNNLNSGFFYKGGKSNARLKTQKRLQIFPLGNNIPTQREDVHMAKKSNNIIDIRPRIGDKWLDGLEKKIDVEGLSEIDYSDVTRVHKASNDSIDDEVVFGPKVKAQLLHTLPQFGFSELPKTWGELMGVIDLCYMLRSSWLGKRGTSEEERMKANAIKSIDEYFPEYSKIIRPYMDKNIPLLTSIIKRDGLMEKLGKEYREPNE